MTHYIYRFYKLNILILNYGVSRIYDAVSYHTTSVLMFDLFVGGGFRCSSPLCLSLLLLIVFNVFLGTEKPLSSDHVCDPYTIHNLVDNLEKTLKNKRRFYLQDRTIIDL